MIIDKWKQNKSTDDRLQDLSIPVTESGCWLWLGSTDKDGYGNIQLEGKRCRAHRVSFEVYKGTIDSGLVVSHTCNERSCINPDHLLAATQSENVQYMYDSGSYKKETKLSYEDIAAIVDLYGVKSSRDVARMFDVSKTTILRVWKGYNTIMEYL